ncbi:MAG: hypothetical protein KBS58_05770 [Bacteroidales bacterium]|nr:hypothetical protein [Candidatus Cacconaster equi]
MKHLLLILAILLSWSLRDSDPAIIFQQDIVSSSTLEEEHQDQPESNYSAPAILPVQTARFSGETSNFVPSARTSHSGHRSQVSQKFPFRVIKTGKIIDRSNLSFFLTELKQFPSGIHSISRYIHSICQLLN